MWNARDLYTPSEQRSGGRRLDHWFWSPFLGSRSDFIELGSVGTLFDSAHNLNTSFARCKIPSLLREISCYQHRRHCYRKFSQAITLSSRTREVQNLKFIHITRRALPACGYTSPGGGVSEGTHPSVQWAPVGQTASSSFSVISVTRTAHNNSTDTLDAATVCVLSSCPVDCHH